MASKVLPFLVSIPHSGEDLPPEANWLKGLPEQVLMCDVDRFVDKLYAPALKRLGIVNVITHWHRYCADLNRLPEDVDASTVQGNSNPPGKFSRGFLWRITTTGLPLMTEAVSQEVLQALVKRCFEPFHAEIKAQALAFKNAGAKNIYHLDAHSMPSKGTSEHRDPGEFRADFVVSDQMGKSCCPEFLNLVVEAYQAQGFKVKVNWPYYGGRITEIYGQPTQGHHTLQVEMNRGLYMDESSKQLIPDKAHALQPLLMHALQHIQDRLVEIL